MINKTNSFHDASGVEKRPHQDSAARMSTMDCFDFAVYFIFDGSGYKYQQRTCHQWVPDEVIISTFDPLK